MPDSLLQENPVDGRVQSHIGFVSVHHCSHIPPPMLIPSHHVGGPDMTIIAGSGLLSISIALNSISLHGTCTAVFMVVAMICAFLLASIQTLEKISWITYAGFVSLVVSRE